MSIKQINVTYFLNEDRIIFRFNTIDQCEYKFWLTRRITHFILIATGKFAENEFQQNPPSTGNVISIFQTPEKQESSYTEAYEPGNKYPIGADALLPMEAKCEMIKMEGQDIFSLDFTLPGGGNVNIKMPLHLMKSMILLLEELNIQAKWGNPANTFNK